MFYLQKEHILESNLEERQKSDKERRNKPYYFESGTVYIGEWEGIKR